MYNIKSSSATHGCQANEKNMVNVYAIAIREYFPKKKTLPPYVNCLFITSKPIVRLV